MKDEWKVFIRGVEGHGNEIINPTCSLCQCNFLILKYRFF